MKGNPEVLSTIANMFYEPLWPFYRKIVHDSERRAQSMNLQEIDAELLQLTEIERKITDELTVTNSYMPQVHELRQHIEFVADKLQKRKAALQGQMPGQGQAQGQIELQA